MTPANPTGPAGGPDAPPRRVVVTGGAGFIGRRLVAALAGRAWPTRVIDDLSSGDAAALPAAAELVTTSVTDAAAAAAIREFRPDVIVHAAAQVSVARSVADPDLDWRINVGGTERVIEAALASGARLVFISSGGAIYGEADGAGEDALPNPISPYGRSKLRAEDLVRGSGASFAIARPSNVYGPGQRTDLEGGVVAIVLERLLADEPIAIHGTGEQSRDFVHVDDIVSALLRMAVAQVDGTWNVATGEAITILELIRLAEATVGRVARTVAAPRRPGDITTSRLSVAGIAADLGWWPSIDMSRGLRETVAELARTDA